jgi:hypothetical protein
MHHHQKGETVELSTALKRVRQLIEKAEHPIAPGATPEERMAAEREQASARAMADDIMQRFAIEEWQAMQKADKSTKPTRIRVDIGEGNSLFLTETASLANMVASYCRCSSVWMRGSGFSYSGRERQEYCWVYGYESDLRYFELLFTTLYLHMSGAIFPKPDPARSLEANAYELHNAGLNWYDIAQAYGWAEVPSRPGEAKHTYQNKDTGERASWGRTIGRIKSAYAREIARRGEEPLRIPPNGSANFRYNAAQGYLAAVNIRLSERMRGRGAGAELVLADRTQNITAMIAEDFPDTTTTQARKTRFNPTAYGLGVRHGKSAALDPEAGTAPAKGIH